MAYRPLDLRRYPRVNVAEGYCVRFQSGERRFFGLPVTTLGGGGCCFRVSVLLAADLKQDAILTRVYIEHPGIPKRPQRARITWVQDLPHRHEGTSILVGIEYLEPDLEFIEAIDRCITELLANPALKYD